MIRKKLKKIINPRSMKERGRLSKSMDKRNNLSGLRFSNLSTSLSKSRSISSPIANKLSKMARKRSKDYPVIPEITLSSFKSRGRTALNFRGTQRIKKKTLESIPRILYSKLEDDIERNLDKIGHKRRGFEEKGPGIIKTCRENLMVTKMKLEALVSILRFRKCKDILNYSHVLADTVIDTKLPLIIITVLDFFIPLLQNYNELTLIKKYARILLDYSRDRKHSYGKLRASEFFGFYYRMNSEFDKALKRYFKMLDYSLKINSKDSEIKAYSNIGMCYYYLGEIEKSAPFERRAVMGILEPRESRLRKDVNGWKKEYDSDSEGEEITLQDNVFGESENENNIEEMTPSQRLKYLRGFRQSKAKYMAKKFDREKRMIRLPGIMRRMHKEKGRMKNILKSSLSFEEMENKKKVGLIWQDKRVFMNNHLSPYRNKSVHDVFAQRRFKSYRSRSMKKSGEISMRQHNSYATTLGKIFMIISVIEKDVEKLSDLYDKLENSYCIHTFYFETQMKKVEAENQRLFAKDKALGDKSDGS